MQAGASPSPVTCAVCETVQPPASVCAACGLPLHLPKGIQPIADPPIEQVPDLEVTVADAVEIGASETVADLEPTIAEAAGDVLIEPPPDLERVEPEPDDLPGLEDLPGLDDGILDIEPTSLPFERLPPEPEGYPRLCPYCGFEQSAGRVCDNCGRSRVRVLRSRAPAAGSGPALRDLPMVRCRGCGAMVRAEALCSDCGQPLVPPEP